MHTDIVRHKQGVESSVSPNKVVYVDGVPGSGAERSFKLMSLSLISRGYGLSTLFDNDYIGWRTMGVDYLKSIWGKKLLIDPGVNTVFLGGPAYALSRMIAQCSSSGDKFDNNYFKKLILEIYSSIPSNSVNILFNPLFFDSCHKELGGENMVYYSKGLLLLLFNAYQLIMDVVGQQDNVYIISGDTNIASSAFRIISSSSNEGD